jgi:type II secretory pathway component PulK
MRSGMTAAEFLQVEPLIIGPNTNGLININTASAAVLQCLPGMDTNSAVQLATYRQSIQTDPNNQNTITWVTQALPQQTLTQIGPRITGRAYQFTADVAAVGHNGRGYRRVRFVFDISSGTPMVVYRQDLSDLGWALGKQVRDNLLTAKQTP